MSRFTLRFIPLLALFFALSAVAKADFVPDHVNRHWVWDWPIHHRRRLHDVLSGRRLLTWLVEVGPDTGPNAFDITDDGIATMTITYERLTNSFDSIGTFNSENNDFFILHSTLTWSLSSLQGDSREPTP